MKLLRIDGTTEYFEVLEECPSRGIARIRYRNRVLEIPLSHVATIAAHEGEPSNDGRIEWVKDVGLVVSSSVIAHFSPLTVGGLWRKEDEKSVRS
jgi:hypothetical protein